MAKPLISVIVNCYNGEKFLKNCINSVLQQSYQNLEIIFWNNKSTDKSVEILNSFSDKRIKVFNSNIHTNIAVARNNAIKKTTGKFICFLDVDDYWHKDKLLLQIESFDDEVGVSFTDFWYLKKQNNIWNKKKIHLQFKEGLIRKIITKYEIVLSTLMFKRSAICFFEKPFNEEYKIIHDFDLVLRLALNNKFKHLKDNLTFRTWHGENETILKREVGNNELEKWILENKNNYSKYNYELKLLKNKIFYDKINFKIKKKQYLKAMKIFIYQNMFFKINYIFNIFKRYFVRFER